MARVKICGVTRSEDVRAAAEAGAHAIGLNFAAESPRFISTPEAARTLVAQAKISTPILWAGVFANASAESIEQTVKISGLNIVQLHGEELPEFAAKLRAKLPSGIAIWKAIRVAQASDLAVMAQYSACDAILLDARVSGVRGGSGKSFDWDLLKNLKRSLPLVLAGGLNPANVQEAVRRVRPDWVDTASGVEIKPGVKDAALIASFVRNAG